MATQPTAPKAPAAPKPEKKKVDMYERMKNQLNAQALKGKLTLDDLSDLEQHVKKLASFLGAPA